ncbi:unnamed protein product [Candida verbasci]|uniref:ATP synthase F(0) complex subunit e, mitochondrial n=1 Tax=Candida verbasci TaxID=1227364 RepID=A0A9W4U1C8_9ASCO|nr:unnamed protein product [Candida verbasci]
MSTINVLRYSVLGLGIVYGAFHRYSLESSYEKQEFQKRWANEEKLIRQAKKEYSRINAPPKAKDDNKSGSINWEDPNLDIGKALESIIAKLD